MQPRRYDEQDDCKDQEIALVGVTWSDNEDGNLSRKEVTCLKTLEALEVLSNSSPSNNNLDIHRLQKENEELIKLNEHILRDIEKHATDKHKLNKEISKL